MPVIQNLLARLVPDCYMANGIVCILTSMLVSKIPYISIVKFFKSYTGFPRYCKKQGSTKHLLFPPRFSLEYSSHSVNRIEKRPCEPGIDGNNLSTPNF